MMKKILILFSFLIFKQFSFSQNFYNENTIGVNLSTEIGNYTINLFPNLTIEKDKHYLSAGPILKVYPNITSLKNIPDNAIYPTQEKHSGFHVFYQYNFQPDKFLDYFIQSNFTFEKLELTDYKNSTTNERTNYEWKIKYVYQTIGTGIKLNFTERIYMTTSFDLGFIIFKKLSLDAEKLDPQNSLTDNLAGFLKIGIGYKFKKHSP